MSGKGQARHLLNNDSRNNAPLTHMYQLETIERWARDHRDFWLGLSETVLDALRPGADLHRGCSAARI